jgi:hypothetical protein
LIGSKSVNNEQIIPEAVDTDLDPLKELEDGPASELTPQPAAKKPRKPRISAKKGPQSRLVSAPQGTLVPSTPTQMLEGHSYFQFAVQNVGNMNPPPFVPENGTSGIGYAQTSHAAPYSSFQSSPQQHIIPPPPAYHFVPQLSPRSVSNPMPMITPSRQEQVAAGSQSSQYLYPAPSQNFDWAPMATSNSQPLGGYHMTNLQGHGGATQGRPYGFDNQSAGPFRFQ